MPVRVMSSVLFKMCLCICCVTYPVTAHEGGLAPWRSGHQGGWNRS